jgi:tetratricopeptide (TPR) repeat protein
MNCRVLALVALGVAFSQSCLPANASPKKPSPSAKASKAKVQSPSGYSQDQVDGIVSASVDDLWAYTDQLWHHGDYPRIIALDRVIVEADPHFEEPYATGAWLMESNGNNPDAEAFYKLGVTRNPESSYMWYNLATFYFNTLKNYSEAVKASEVGVTKEGADVNDWRVLAHAYEKNNQLAKALETWKTIKKKFPEALAVDMNLERVQKLVDGGTATPGPAPQPPPDTPPAGKANPKTPSTPDNPIISL